MQRLTAPSGYQQVTADLWLIGYEADSKLNHQLVFSSGHLPLLNCIKDWQRRSDSPWRRRAATWSAR